MGYSSGPGEIACMNSDTKMSLDMTKFFDVFFYLLFVEQKQSILNTAIGK